MLLFGHLRSFFPTPPESNLVCLATVRRAVDRTVCLPGRLPRTGLVVLFFLLCALGSLRSVRAKSLDDGIRIDLPASRQLRVENQFGDVEVQVVKERDV